MKKARGMVFFYCVFMILLLLCVFCGSRTVTVLSENSSVEYAHRIVIDAGHGGEDGGAVSHSGLPESSYNLEISLRLNDLLNLMGYPTIMTRTSDISIYTKGETLAQKKTSDLKERVRLINETEGAVLLSIHQNYYSDESCHGPQVFYAETEGSEELAKLLQAELTAGLSKGGSRQAKKCSSVYLMEHVQQPAVLIECGFLSNPSEDALLKTPFYQKKICSIIAIATCRYLSNT